MEKKLTKKELLSNLLTSAQDPFSSTEKVMDIKRILADSNSFDGTNHLLLVEAFLKPMDYPFPMTKKEAEEQANLAIKEGNHFGYYYLYLLSNDAQEKRKCLEIASFYGYMQAVLEIAKCYHIGYLFEKNLEKAYTYYSLAANKGERKGYIGMIEIDADLGNKEKQKQDYLKAQEAGFSLPGVIE